MSNPIRKVSKYTIDVVEELKRCSWPGKSELVQSSILVLITCILLAIFVQFADQILQTLIESI
ncbi:preprotein translocase subunit SecE [Lentisphaera marina]|jgi:preprotein translocase subunit SecE|uniref:preprotein translocase subunit SecE n=1 Tax=Lentisphaera marina TaxID=1111041 RepID=UPI002366963B|nr:preprotein translocase subunit SecE [Lentisphaera marina]MDD7985801.1 preprotein translocase subunit SecE [Lentisphaera marina]